MKKIREIEIENEIETHGPLSDNTNRHSLPNLPISKANAMAIRHLRDIALSPDEDDEEARELLNSLIQRIKNQKDQIGEVDDFHNFAVDLASKNEFGLACIILECGMKLFPKNVDLLSDFLEYGKNCNRREESKQIFNDLNKIPRHKWTWRGFAFSISYLLDQSDLDNTIDEKNEDLKELALSFRSYFPYSDESYRSEASIYQKFNQQDKELEILKRAMVDLEVCPRCALKCADILFNRGMYEASLEAIQRGIRDANQTQTSVSEGYIYYLSALSKIAISQKKNIPLLETNILDIYSSFNIALKEFGYSSAYNNVIASKTNTLIVKYGVEIPQELERLVECMIDF
jgi:tetratricopeptide (TPR) repeat protein